MTDVDALVDTWTFECSIAFLASLVHPNQWPRAKYIAYAGQGLVFVPGHVLDTNHCRRLLTYKKKIFCSLSDLEKFALREGLFDAARLKKFSMLGLLERGQWTNFGLSLVHEAREAALEEARR